MLDLCSIYPVDSECFHDGLLKILMCSIFISVVSSLLARQFSFIHYRNSEVEIEFHCTSYHIYLGNLKLFDLSLIFVRYFNQELSWAG